MIELVRMGKDGEKESVYLFRSGAGMTQRQQRQMSGESG